METTGPPFSFDFTGTWLTDTDAMFILEQKECNVAGTFTSPGCTALIEGTVQGLQLDFTCYDALTIHKEVNGKGILAAAAGTRSCSGTWEYSPYQTSNEPIRAKALEPIPPELMLENLPADDKMSLKYAGYDLVRKREYIQAIPLLEQALQLYRDEMHQESTVIDGYLIDEVRILASLLDCYFQLALPDTQRAESEAQQHDFYITVVNLLLASVSSYQRFLQRTFQRHTHGLAKEITKAAEQLRHWQEQLHVQAHTLQNASHGTSDERVPRMLSLAALLQEITTYLFDASTEIVTRGEQAFGQVEALVQALAALSDFCDDIQQQVQADLERMRDSSKEWPAEQAEFIQWLSLLLVPIPLHIEGQRKLIAQTQKNAQERVDYTWGSAFRLSNWLERWRIRLPSDVEKIKALEGGQPFFQKLINFYVDVHNGAEALVLSERARTRAFADLLAARSTLSQSSQASSLQRDTALSSQPPSNLEEMLKVVQTRKSVTIEYFLTPERLLIWIITPAGRIETISVAISKDRLDQLICALLLLLETSVPTQVERTRTITLLRELYRYLIAPVPRDLFPTTREEVLTVIPHGSLFQVPFAALQSEEGTYFIEEHALVYAPSIDILRYIQNNKKHVFNADQPTLLAFVSPEQTFDVGLSPLEFSARNFESIVAFYHDRKRNKIYKGRDAVRQNLEQESSRHAVLCFVTHAKALDDDPLNSYLVLAGESFENGLLKVPEIARLDLHTDLVILAACETGRGHITGDGVNGLSRAFISAGTPSLLISLWSVPERETMQQLYLFHNAWLEDYIAKAQALQRVQLDRIHNYGREQPDVWAGLVLMGEAI